MKKSYGPCVSKERCKEILTEEIQDLLPEEKWKDYERSVNRVLYEFDKSDGMKPKLHKGKHINNVWISVEKRLPEEKEWKAYHKQERCVYMRRMEIAYMTDTVEYTHGYYDGYKWMDKWYGIIKNVVAWKIHEPYRPECTKNPERKDKERK